MSEMITVDGLRLDDAMLRISCATSILSTLQHAQGSTGGEHPKVGELIETLKGVNMLLSEANSCLLVA